MNEVELGNEEVTENTSSAELPQSETETPLSEEAVEEVQVEETSEETDSSEPVAEASSATDEEDDSPEDDDTTTEETESDDGSVVDVEASTDETEEDDSPRLRRGEVVEGTVTKTSPTAVYVDVGIANDGIIPGRELELMSRKFLENLKEGEKINVYVVNPKNHKGETVLSVNRALEELDWVEAEAYRKSKEVYEGKIAGYNKGGLIVRFGRLRGFLPHSQVSETRRQQMVGETPEERYGQMINEPIQVKVMEVHRNRNRLILSERVAVREIRQKAKEELISELAVGDERTGRVVSLEDFGAFVDVGGAEGLIHVTELAWKHVTHPRQIVSIGEEVQVKVINIDPEQNRIGLSLKQMEADPWDQIATAFQDGQLVQGVITKLTKFGAFAQIIDAPEVEGLIHVSELSDERVDHPKEVVKKGDKLTLRVVKIDVRNRRLGLSLRRVNSSEYLDLDWAQDFDRDN